MATEPEPGRLTGDEITAIPPTMQPSASDRLPTAPPKPSPSSSWRTPSRWLVPLLAAAGSVLAYAVAESVFRSSAAQSQAEREEQIQKRIGQAVEKAEQECDDELLASDRRHAQKMIVVAMAYWSDYEEDMHTGRLKDAVSRLRLASSVLEGITEREARSLHKDLFPKLREARQAWLTLARKVEARDDRDLVQLLVDSKSFVNWVWHEILR